MKFGVIIYHYRSYKYFFKLCDYFPKTSLNLTLKLSLFKQIQLASSPSFLVDFSYLLNTY